MTWSIAPFGADPLRPAGGGCGRRRSAAFSWRTSMRVSPRSAGSMRALAYTSASAESPTDGTGATGTAGRTRRACATSRRDAANLRGALTGRGRGQDERSHRTPPCTREPLMAMLGR